MLEKIGHEWLLKTYADVRFVSKDGKYLALGSKDGDICVVNVKKMEHELVELRHHISSQGVVNSLEQVALTCMGKFRDEIFLFPGGFSSDNQACLDIIMAKQLPKTACHSIFFKLILAILRQESSDALRRGQYALLLNYFRYFQHKLDLDIPSAVLQFLLLESFKHVVKGWLRYSSNHPIVLLTSIATALLSLKVWVLNSHGLIRLKAKVLFGGAFLIREVMFVNECHIVHTRAIDKRLVCHLGGELHVTISY
ncbi:putative WD40/YVTN repeat-like-containing domain-containing protein [Rosa chinensis]|uniref:Putative WD40/YVTN repeat-like-containing domain-containing protein n=1 Tax=Rosa chinensis TaxID=74649 RepID=A0A2P6RDE7_ROSCH|nr:putative WD40/YVTN repeat-like-containing domain-containing protein [Rosa chinensis]